MAVAMTPDARPINRHGIREGFAALIDDGSVCSSSRVGWFSTARHYPLDFLVVVRTMRKQ
jgi:hypothetical protein